MIRVLLFFVILEWVDLQSHTQFELGYNSCNLPELVKYSWDNCVDISKRYQIT